jgi:hypothetical protein
VHVLALFQHSFVQPHLISLHLRWWAFILPVSSLPIYRIVGPCLSSTTYRFARELKRWLRWSAVVCVDDSRPWNRTRTDDADIILRNMASSTAAINILKPFQLLSPPPCHYSPHTSTSESAMCHRLHAPHAIAHACPSPPSQT